MSAPTSPGYPRHSADVVIVLNSDGSGTVTLGHRTETIDAADAALARAQALAIVVREAVRSGAPIEFLAIDGEGQRSLVANPDRSVRSCLPTPKPPVLTGVGGRGRVSKLPAGDRLRVPNREDTGTAAWGTPLGSPADAPAAARPVSSPQHDLSPGPDAPDAVATAVDPKVRAARRRRHQIWALVLVATITPGGVAAGYWWDAREKSLVLHAALTAESNAAAAEVTWITQRQHAVAVALGEQRRARARSAAREVITSAAQVLGASEGRVTGEDVRTTLAAAIVTLEDDLDDGNPASWSRSTDAVSSAIEQVRASQTAWEQAEAQRIADEQAAAAAAAAAAQARTPATSTAPRATTGSTSSPPPTTTTQVEQLPGSERFIKPGRVSWDSGSPGSVTVSVTTGGITGPVVVNIAGSSMTVGVGSGTFTGTMTDLPAGSYTWTASADGLVATSTTPATVP